MGNANEDLVKKGYDAFGKGDMDTLRSIMAADVVHSVAGNNAISGDHKGIDNVLAYYGKMFEMTGGSLSADLKSATAKGDDHVVSVHQAKGTRGDKSIDVEESLDFTFKDGKIARIDETSADQAAEDAFWV